MNSGYNNSEGSELFTEVKEKEMGSQDENKTRKIRLDRII